MKSVFDYEDHMKDIDSDLFKNIQQTLLNFKNVKFTQREIITAINKDRLDIGDAAALLSQEAEQFLPLMAKRSSQLTKQYFGNSISIFTPLYLSNYCDSKCTYCGFQKGNKIARASLDEQEIHEEMRVIADSGIEEILLLTGESRDKSSPEYIANACKIARKFFRVVGVEIYVLNIDEYELLQESGCDFVTVYQETYNPEKYSRIHVFGEKRSMLYRINAQERALLAGMRGVSFGSLLGIDDFRQDALACIFHAYYIHKKYPHAEISLSIPRLRPIINNNKISPRDVSEARLLQVLCAYRIFFPFANITISTRERAGFRDEVIKLGANKMSAGVSVGINEHSGNKKGDDQFEISDRRDLDQVLSMLKNRGFQAVMSDSLWLRNL